MFFFSKLWVNQPWWCLPWQSPEAHFCAMHHFPDEARANHLNPGLMTHAGLIHGRHASQCVGLVATSPTIHKQWRSLLRGEANHRQRRWSVCRNGCVFQPVMSRCMCIEHVLFWIVLTQAVVVKQVTTNHTTGTPILHVEVSCISAERGMRREILSRTSLKCYIQFSSFLSLQFSFANNSKGLWLSMQCIRVYQIVFMMLVQLLPSAWCSFGFASCLVVDVS